MGNSTTSTGVNPTILLTLMITLSLATVGIFWQRMAEENASTPGKSLWFRQPILGLRRLFYLVTPEDAAFENVSQVPNYVLEAFPYFGGLILLEAIILAFRDKKSVLRINDSISSLGAGAISEMPGLLGQASGRGAQILAYTWIHEKYCFYELPWNSPWTWVLAALAVDYGYYWFHRTGHEVNFFWASHQTHHSSEEYNLVTALRQSVHHKFTGWMFYLPMALFVPPSIFLVHLQFNLLYQFWIHTEVIGDLGFLEYIINTPSAHRVHHGRNRYCIDKNYAGTLIVWDILHGTFEREKQGEDKVVYGLVHPAQTWDPVHTQMGHVEWIWKCVTGAESLADKLKHIFYGPGWMPGKPRMGDMEDIPDVKYPQPRFDARPEAPVLSFYCLIQFAVAFSLITFMQTLKQNLTEVYALLYIVYTVGTLKSLAAIMDKVSRAALLKEMIRCLSFVVLSRCGALGVGTLLSTDAALHLEVFNLLSAAFVGFLAWTNGSDSSKKEM